MSKSLKVTKPAEAVLHVFLDDPARHRFGLELSTLAGITPFALYPVLARLEAAGWLISDWDETPADHDTAAPRRRRYRITPSGLEKAARTVRSKTSKQGWRRLYWPTPRWTQR